MRHNFGSAAFMRVVGVGMQQADADGANAARAEITRGFVHAGLIERAQFKSAKIQPAAGLTDELAVEERCRVLTARLTRDLEDVPETGVNDQAERIDLALQQRVGGNRGAVGKARNMVGGGARTGENLLHTTQQADGWICRGACYLSDLCGAGDDVDRNDIGECAAGIDANAKPRRCGLTRHASRHSAGRDQASMRSGKNGSTHSALSKAEYR